MDKNFKKILKNLLEISRLENIYIIRATNIVKVVDTACQLFDKKN